MISDNPKRIRIAEKSVVKPTFTDMRLLPLVNQTWLLKKISGEVIIAHASVVTREVNAISSTFVWLTATRPHDVESEGNKPSPTAGDLLSLLTLGQVFLG